MNGMRRIRVTFWVLVAIAIVSTGVLMRAVAWPTGPGAGATLAAAGMVTAIAVASAARILVVIGRTR